MVSPVMEEAKDSHRVTEVMRPSRMAGTSARAGFSFSSSIFSSREVLSYSLMTMTSGARSTTSSQLTVAQVVSMSSKILTPPAWEISLAVKLSPQV